MRLHINRVHLLSVERFPVRYKDYLNHHKQHLRLMQYKQLVIRHALLHVATYIRQILQSH